VSTAITQGARSSADASRRRFWQSSAFRADLQALPQSSNLKPRNLRRRRPR